MAATSQPPDRRRPPPARRALDTTALRTRPEVLGVERFALQARRGQDERLRQVVIVRLFRFGFDFPDAVRVAPPDGAA